MKKTRTIAVAASLAAAGLIISVGTATAQNSTCPNPASQGPRLGQQGAGMGRHQGAGMGQMWRTQTKKQAKKQAKKQFNKRGKRAGDCRNLPASGTLTEAQKQELAWMAEEEKVAHDLYAFFATTYTDVRFPTIATAETRHLEAVRVLLARYQVADPTAGKDSGVFTSERAQSMYDTLLARGQAGLTDALAVGADVERADIADLDALRSDVQAAPDVDRVATNLMRASKMHLRAFTR